MKSGSFRLLLGTLGAHKGLVALAWVCMLILAGATAGYAWITGPLLHFLTSGDISGLGPFASLVPGFDPQTLDRDSALVLVPGVMVVLGAAKGLAWFGQFSAMGLVAQRAVAGLRQRLFDRILLLSPKDLEKQRTGDLLTRFGADVQAVEQALQIAVPTYLRDGVSALALLGLCFYLDWRLALLAFGLMPLAIFPLSRLGKRLKRVSHQGQRSVGRLAEFVHETTVGIRVVQAYGMEEHTLSRFDEENRKWLALQRKSLFSRGLASPAMELLTVTGIALSIAFAVRAVDDGALLSSELLSFLATVALLFQPAKNLGKVGGFLLQGLASMERLSEVLDLEPSIVDRPGARALPPFETAITFEAVDFAHGDRPILQAFDLTLHKGEVVALVGPSGAGKTTLANLLSRTVEPTGGRVAIDGVDLREVKLSSLRDRVAMVPQEVLLFDDTIRANVAYGLEVDDETIRNALAAAHALAFVEVLPEGLETMVGERGMTLSGGQRQRLAIARALLRDAPILILDEATSALDSESEREVQAALETLWQGRTAVVIAHRLSTVRNADRICVLEGGRIVEEGTHDELLSRGGAYKRLHDLQGIEPGAEAA